jgi:PhoPQ-activated pathogenicity-related protein
MSNKNILLPILFLILFSCEKQNTVLKDFVNQSDEAFNYEIRKVVVGESWKEFIIYMVSQNWLTNHDVDQTEWWHWLSIVIPNDVKESEALMVISGGNHNNKMPDNATTALVQIAMATHSIVAEISNIPFQPITFKNDDFGERYEDDLIAFGWRHFLEDYASDKNAPWLAHMPMTKAVSRGMDVVQAVSGLEGKPVNNFVTTGASKRGWTTWCTAIADDRVIAVIPIVIDMLNVESSFDHHWKCYGEWSHAVDSYVHEGIMDWMGSREFNRLNEIVEPYSFIQELDLPKFLINATGDEFFVTDSWQFYWDDLEGESYLQYIPNTNHGLKNLDGDYNLKSLTAFYHSVITESDRPVFDWYVRQDSIYIVVDHVSNENYSILQWEAVNETARDFRVDAIGRSWASKPLLKTDDGRYAVKISQPETGYRAGLLEITFNPNSEIPFTFTSGTVVTPNSFPFESRVIPYPKGTR